jgi:hypothetical protein
MWGQPPRLSRRAQLGGGFVCQSLHTIEAGLRPAGQQRAAFPTFGCPPGDVFFALLSRDLRPESGFACSRRGSRTVNREPSGLSRRGSRVLLMVER